MGLKNSSYQASIIIGFIFVDIVVRKFYVKVLYRKEDCLNIHGNF
jgi:hypothetical protein